MRTILVCLLISGMLVSCIEEDLPPGNVPCLDGDGDGVCFELDCNDNNSSLYPGAPCDDGNPNTTNDVIDQDCNCGSPLVDCGNYADNDGDGVCSDIDCNDNNPDIYPGAPCNDELPFTFFDQYNENCNCNGTFGVMDIDGNIYEVIWLNDTWWMKENLRVTRYRNGDEIPARITSEQWQGSSGAARAYNQATDENLMEYGRVYNWEAVNDPRGLCPEQFRMPTAAEWDDMVNAMGSDPAGKLKSVSGLWMPPNTGADNSSDFTAEPAGFREPDGDFVLSGYTASFWTASEVGASSAYSFTLTTWHTEADMNIVLKKSGLSCRCVVD